VLLSALDGLVTLGVTGAMEHSSGSIPCSYRLVTRPRCCLTLWGPLGWPV